MSQRGQKVSKRVPKADGDTGTTKIAKKTKSGKTARMKRKGGKTGKMSRASKTARKKDQALEPITPFNRGLSIGVKFAGLTAVVVGLFMGLLGYLTYSISARNIDDAITEQGVSIVSTLEKSVDRRFWIGQQPPLIRQNDNKNPPPQPAPFDRSRLIKDWQQRLKAMIEESGGKMEQIAVFDKEDGGALERVVQYPLKDVTYTPVKKLTSEDEPIVIEDVRMSGQRVRRFSKKLSLDALAEDKKVTALVEAAQGGEKPEEAVAKLQELFGRSDLKTPEDWRQWREYENPPLFLRDEVKGSPWVSIFVKASRLDDVKAEMKSRIAIVTLCGAFAGILLTALIATVLTGPIRELETDIGEVAGGNLGHQSRVRSKDEIGGLAHVFNIMARNLRVAQENAVERQAFERELNIAKEIQEKLLPERIPQIPGFDIESHYNAAKEVGGDYYDFIVIDQNHLGIIVADVAGKGIPGAMVMTMARSLVRLASVRNVSPADTFKKVNRILAKDIRRGMFVTAAYMVLNVKNKTVRVASAGHNPVVLYRAKTNEIELIKPKGIALGFDKGTIFDNNIQEEEVQLEPGDRLVTYTDGVNEAMNNNSEEFGDERFYELTKQHATKTSKEFVAAVVAALDEHRGSAEQSDDITITTLGVAS